MYVFSSFGGERGEISLYWSVKKRSYLLIHILNNSNNMVKHLLLVPGAVLGAWYISLLTFKSLQGSCTLQRRKLRPRKGKRPKITKQGSGRQGISTRHHPAAKLPAYSTTPLCKTLSSAIWGVTESPTTSALRHMLLGSRMTRCIPIHKT